MEELGRRNPLVNKNRKKGDDWERKLVEILNTSLNGKFKRIPGSGSFGTLLNESLLTSDVVGVVDGISKQFRFECKTGYGSETQFTLKKEWLDKIKKEADACYAIPVLAGKFLGSRSGVKQFIVLDIDTFILLVNMLSEAKEHAELYDLGSNKKDL